MIILKILLASIVLVSPVFIGLLFDRKLIIDAYLYGQILMWALFQIVAVPFVLFRMSFNSLVITFSVIILVLFVLGAKKFPENIKNLEKPQISIPLILAMILIIGQMMIYLFGMHLDEDDARWLAEANDAIVKNMMLLNNPATGAYVGVFRGEVLKDVFSPWSMYIATISKMTGINVAVMAHTILAPVLLGVSYMVYHKISKSIFKGETESGLFLLSVAVINMFFGGNRHTQAFTTLIRIWQGKAIIAAIMIPMLFFVFLVVMEEDTWKNWMWILFVDCASCLFSGMGIAISLIMVGVLGAYAIVCKRWKRIPLWFLSMVPSILFGLGYYITRQ